MEEKVKDTTTEGKQEYSINIGPQHPSTHGVMRLVVSLRGEVVQKVEPHIGYIHRGIEKMCESLTYPQIIHLTDRMDYLSAHVNNEAVCLAVEKALEIEIPDRVKVIRTIMSELTRIQSHELFWASYGMDLGGQTCYFYGLRDREMVLDIFEETTGGRMLVSYNCPGGVMNDLHPNFQKRVKEFLKHFRKVLPEYDSILTGNVIFHQRTIGIGPLSLEDAIAYGVTGPSARASGLSCDVRKHEPYSAYDRIKFNEVIYNEGDAYYRYLARMEEMRESMDIIDQLIDNIPEGPYAVKMKPVIKLPEGEYYQRVETARRTWRIYYKRRQQDPFSRKVQNSEFW
jgi:NADH-quinone oxidoreductase subunit D/NADH-quinone oxidoreductase subunit C/D